jgi:hypothetical protein
MPPLDRWLRAGLTRWALRELYRTFRREKDRRTRGLLLLREWLSPQQLAQYSAKGYFDVVGCDTGRRYRIRHGTAGNVHEIDSSGRAGTRFCFLPVGGLVEGDVMLAQKIAIETDELKTLAVANSFPPQVRWALPGVRPF